jgi:inhibitor of cysteine peptidase
MNKLIFPAAVAVLAITILAGCGGAPTYTDPAAKITANVGDRFVIALDSNPTTGYGWEIGYDMNELELVKDEYKPDEKAAGLVGAGGTQYYELKALKTGDSEITLVYKRSWETEVIETRIFTVEIK